MVKLISKSQRALIMALTIPFMLLNAGCFLFPTSDSSIKAKISTIEEKFDLLFESIEKLNATNHKFIDKLDGLKSENKGLSKEYAQITKNQSSIKSLQELQESESNRFREEMLSTRNLISKIKQELTIRPEHAKRMKSAPDPKPVVKKKAEKKLRKKPSRPKRVQKKAEKSIVKKKDVQKKARKKSSVKKDLQKKAKKSIESSVTSKKEPQKKLKAALVKKLFNRAKTLYRRGKYEEAIKKWEEVLKQNPTMLDAMYNIEIAKDRIKTRQSKSGK